MLVRLERAMAAFGLDGPDLDRLVVRGGEQQEASRVEHQAADPVVVSDQSEQAYAGAGVPQLRRT